MQRLKEEKGSKRLSEGIMCLCCVLSLLLASCNSDPYADCKTWEERETLLIQKYEKSDKDFNRLMFRWLSEPEASSYPFDSLQMDRPFCKTVSPDGKLCVFSWDSFEGGLTGKWNTVIHYEHEGKKYMMDRNLWQLLPQRGAHAGLAVDEEGTDNGCLTMRIYQVKDMNGRTVYLTENHLLDARYSYSSINAYTIMDGMLRAVPEMFITADRNICDALETSFDMYTWYDRIEKFVGPKSVYGFSKEKGELLVPVDDMEVSYSDRYGRYVFNGSKFIYTDEVAGKDIHPYLQKFSEFKDLYRIDSDIIRVDLMEDGTYRFAAWTSDDKNATGIDLTEEPDRIIHGGIMDESGNWYVFRGNGLEYRLNAVQAGKQTLEIRDKDKIIYKGEKNWLE